MKEFFISCCERDCENERTTLLLELFRTRTRLPRKHSAFTKSETHFALTVHIRSHILRELKTHSLLKKVLYVTCNSVCTKKNSRVYVHIHIHTHEWALSFVKCPKYSNVCVQKRMTKFQISAFSVVVVSGCSFWMCVCTSTVHDSSAFSSAIAEK